MPCLLALCPDLLHCFCRFDLDKASLAAGWKQELLGESHAPETEEYGITSFVYRSHTAFHPHRLWMHVLEQNNLPAVLRSKGFFWIASHPNTAWQWSTAGVPPGAQGLGPIASCLIVFWLPISLASCYRFCLMLQQACTCAVYTSIWRNTVLYLICCFTISLGHVVLNLLLSSCFALSSTSSFLIMQL